LVGRRSIGVVGHRRERAREELLEMEESERK